MKSKILLLLSFINITLLPAQDNIVAATSLLHSTFYHISIHVNIAGDVNLNSYCTMEYKLSSEQDYLPTAKVMRAHPDMIVDGSKLDRNHYAASAMFLESNTSYDIRTTITDPDNGQPYVIENTVWTRAIPTAPQNGTLKYVSPGNGSGQGTASDPYQGLQDASDNATAGDIIIVSPGNYSPFEIRNSGSDGQPITFISEDLHQAIIDGNGTERGIVTIGDYNLPVNDIIIDGFTIQNGAWGIDAQNTAYLTVQNNMITDVDFGFVNRREGNGENDQYITNNLFEGRTTWPQLNGEIAPERAIDIRGNNNVVSYNTIKGFGDGISTDGAPYQSSYGLDIYNNDIYDIVDDFIEIDGNISNTRVHNNRGFNGRMGVSLAPVFGGPVYVFRNVFYNMETSTFKMNRQPAGLFMAHNLGIKNDNGMSSDVGWQSTVMKNNIIMGSRYCFEEYGEVNEDTEDWDYNAYYSSRTGTAGDEWFKWQNLRYADIQALSAGTSIEGHGLATSLSDFENVFMPQIYGVSYSPSTLDLQLSSNSSLIDMGTPLDNINDPYVSDAKPDIGPYEYGKELPRYGVHFEYMTSTQPIPDISYSVSPNPTKGIVNITSDKQLTTVNIYNNNGILIKSVSVNDNDQFTRKTINLSTLSNGVYWIEGKNNNNTFEKKKIILIN